MKCPLMTRNPQLLSALRAFDNNGSVHDLTPHQSDWFAAIKAHAGDMPGSPTFFAQDAQRIDAVGPWDAEADSSVVECALCSVGQIALIAHGRHSRCPSGRDG